MLHRPFYFGCTDEIEQKINDDSEEFGSELALDETLKQVRKDFVGWTALSEVGEGGEHGNMIQNMVENTTVKTMVKNMTDRILTYVCLFIPLLIGITTFVYAENPPENILKNGDFDDRLNQWHHWTDPSANAAFLTEGRKAEPIIGENVAYINIAKGGNAVGHIQLYQQPFFLEKDTIYTYGLWAKSEKPRNATMRIMHQGVPWNVYTSQIISLTQTWKEFFITFTMPEDDVNSRAGIIMGTDTNDVWIDHIRLYEGEHFQDIEGAEPHAIEPVNKLATKWATLKNQD